MRRSLISFLLLLLAMLIGGPLVAAPAPAGEGAQRLTVGAHLTSLAAWPADEMLLARRAGEAPGWLRVDAHSGRLQPAGELLATRANGERLTVEVEGTTHRLLLDGKRLFETDEEILGRPTLAPDGSWLVVGRYPRGTLTASLGELWRYDLATGEWTPLTRNGTDETTPVISPDGERVAFLREGDIWAIPASRLTVERHGPEEPDSAPQAVEEYEAPETIRVAHHPSNQCRSYLKEGEIVTLPFEEYVKRVVPHESPRSWPLETLKAQAIAARTFAWTKVLARKNEPYDVTDWTNDQYMCDQTYSETNRAVEETAGQHLTYITKYGQRYMITAMFSAENSSATRQNAWGHSYLSAVDDPISFGARRYGHGQGYSQWGGKRWADEGWNYLQILRHYYTGALVAPAEGSPLKLLELANRPTTNYLRGSALFLELNGNQITESRVREWKPGADGGLSYGAWQSDSEPADGWSHLLDLRGLGDLPYDRYRVEVASIPDPAPEPRPVLRLGIDRTRPALEGALTVPAQPWSGGSIEVEASFQVSDTLSGVERAGWSQEAWQQEAEIMEGVPVINDPAASGGKALRLEPVAASTTLTFPSLSIEPAHYRLWFRLRTNEIATAEKVATLRLFDNASSPLQRGVRYLRAADFASTDWEWFYVDIDLTDHYARCTTEEEPERTCNAVSPRIEWHGSQRLEIDRLFLANRPATVPTRERLTITPPATLLLYANDQAGNVALTECVPAKPEADTRAMVTAGSAPRMAYSIYLPLVQTYELPRYQCRALP